MNHEYKEVPGDEKCAICGEILEKGMTVRIIIVPIGNGSDKTFAYAHPECAKKAGH